MYKIDCRACAGTNLLPAVSLGMSPLANNLLNSIDDTDYLYPLEMMYCSDCHNCQLSYVVPASKMFDNYLYVSSTAKSFRTHFEEAAEKYIHEFNLTPHSLVVDIGSNDGIALKPLQEAGIKVVGVEPAKNISELANSRGINTINEYFTIDTAQKIKTQHGNADVVTASNVFAHADGLEEIVRGVFSLLKPRGSFIVEVQYLLNTIMDLTFDNIYHEHTNYWSVISLNKFFTRLGCAIYKVEHIDTHGGSIRVYVNREHEVNHIDDSVNTFIEKEILNGLTKYDTYLKFANDISLLKTNTLNNFAKMANDGLCVVGYAAPAKATTVLNYYGMSTDHMQYIIEDNVLKHGKLVPGVKIPIFSRDKLTEIAPDVIVVLAWNFFTEIKNNNQSLIDSGIQLVNIKDLSTL